jgi:adenylosuccinate lyase
MSDEVPLERLIEKLREEYNFSDGSISLLLDKGFEQKEFRRLCEALNLPDETFEERREKKSWMEKTIDMGDSEEITTGRYNRYVRDFKDISSEQALVKGRMKFAVEYVISLAKLLAEHPEHGNLVKNPFSGEEEEKLRSIYKNFRTKDFVIAKIIEDKTNHDIVAANTWANIRAQQLGLDDNLMRGIIHFARTSADVNTNVTGELYSYAIGQWTESIIDLLSELKKRAVEYGRITCVAETHGQDAQLTTLGHIYANLAEQIALHAKPLLMDEKLRLDGKIGGAIGTDVDMSVAFPNIDPTPMYKHIVEDLFDLKYVELGNDQDCSNAALSQALDTMVNVGLVIEKTASDTWLYASRGVIGKITSKGESGSSAMPQKANPYLAEGAEALTNIFTSMINPIKRMLVAYHEQGDLRRSITTREGFHPVMLSIISIGRLIDEIKKYKPSIIAIEEEVYKAGPKIISSAIQNFLRKQGIPDAYDRIKNIVMKDYVKPEQIKSYIHEMVESGKINNDVAGEIESMLYSVMDVEGNMRRLEESSCSEEQNELIERLKSANGNAARMELVGGAVTNTYRMVERIGGTIELLSRYAVSD